MFQNEPVTPAIDFEKFKYTPNQSKILSWKTNKSASGSVNPSTSNIVPTEVSSDIKQLLEIIKTPKKVNQTEVQSKLDIDLSLPLRRPKELKPMISEPDDDPGVSIKSSEETKLITFSISKAVPLLIEQHTSDGVSVAMKENVCKSVSQTEKACNEIKELNNDNDNVDDNTFLDLNTESFVNSIEENVPNCEDMDNICIKENEDVSAQVDSSSIHEPVITKEPLIVNLVPSNPKVSHNIQTTLEGKITSCILRFSFSLFFLNIFNL